jgi:hypothetical protein
LRSKHTYVQSMFARKFFVWLLHRSRLNTRELISINNGTHIRSLEESCRDFVRVHRWRGRFWFGPLVAVQLWSRD